MALCSIKNNPSITTWTYVNEIFHPLFDRFHLNYFAYIKLFHDKSYLILSNNPSWTLHFYKSCYKGIGYTGKNFNSGYYVSSGLEQIGMPPLQLADAANFFNINYPLYKIDVNTNYCEIYIWGAPRDNKAAIDTYFNELTALNNFQQFFKAKANKLIQVANQQKISIPSILHQDFQLTQTVSTTPSTIKPCSRNYLRPKELECLYYLAQGNTSKEIANNLGLSFRTVETYLRNIKERFGYHTKSELIKLYNMLRFT